VRRVVVIGGILARVAHRWSERLPRARELRGDLPLAVAAADVVQADDVLALPRLWIRVEVPDENGVASGRWSRDRANAGSVRVEVEGVVPIPLRTVPVQHLKRAVAVRVRERHVRGRRHRRDVDPVTGPTVE